MLRRVIAPECLGERFVGPIRAARLQKRFYWVSTAPSRSRAEMNLVDIDLREGGTPRGLS